MAIPITVAGRRLGSKEPKGALGTYEGVDLYSQPSDEEKLTNYTVIRVHEGFKCRIPAGNFSGSDIRVRSSQVEKFRESGLVCQQYKWASASLNCQMTKEEPDLCSTPLEELSQEKIYGNTSCSRARIIHDVRTTGESTDYDRKCRDHGRKLWTGTCTNDNIANCASRHGACAFDWSFSGVPVPGSDDVWLHHHAHHTFDNDRHYAGQFASNSGTFTQTAWPNGQPCPAWERSRFTDDYHSRYGGGDLKGCGSKLPVVHVRGVFSGNWAFRGSILHDGSTSGCELVHDTGTRYISTGDGACELNADVRGHACHSWPTQIGTVQRDAWEFGS